MNDSRGGSKSAPAFWPKKENKVGQSFHRSGRKDEAEVWENSRRSLPLVDGTRIAD
jgi:hypothetical protein